MALAMVSPILYKRINASIHNAPCRLKYSTMGSKTASFIVFGVPNSVSGSGAKKVVMMPGSIQDAIIK